MQQQQLFICNGLYHDLDNPYFNSYICRVYDVDGYAFFSKMFIVGFEQLYFIWECFLILKQFSRFFV